MRVEGQLTRPHDQIGRWDWLEAASALTASEHPEERKKERESERQKQKPDWRNPLTCGTLLKEQSGVL